MTRTKHDSRDLVRVDVVDRFDRLFDDWAQLLPFHRPSMLARMADDLIRVDEFHEDGGLVVRAEMPGLDPDKDVELTVSDGMLHITAERREEHESKDKGYVRRELRYGSFARSLPIPAGVTQADVKATYKDGMLEVRVPAPSLEPAAKIPIDKA